MFLSHSNAGAPSAGSATALARPLIVLLGWRACLEGKHERYGVAQRSTQSFRDCRYENDSHGQAGLISTLYM